MLDPEFLALLVCPKCRASLRDTAEGLVCQGPACGLVYAVEDGIPNLLVEEARPGRSTSPESTDGRKKGDS